MNRLRLNRLNRTCDTNVTPAGGTSPTDYTDRIEMLSNELEILKDANEQSVHDTGNEKEI